MGLANTFRQLLRDLASQKLRTFLTTFGIVWGTVAVSLLLAFGDGLHHQMMKNAAGLGKGHQVTRFTGSDGLAKKNSKPKHRKGVRCHTSHSRGGGAAPCSPASGACSRAPPSPAHPLPPNPLRSCCRRTRCRSVCSSPVTSSGR